MGFWCVFSADAPHARTSCWGTSIYSAQDLVLSRRFLNLLTQCGYCSEGKQLFWRLFPLFCHDEFYIPWVWVADGAQGRVGCTGLLTWLTHNQFPIKAVALLSLTATTIINSCLGLNWEQATEVCEDWCSLPARMLEAAKAVTACTGMRKASVRLDFSKWQGNSSKPRITIS